MNHTVVSNSAKNDTDGLYYCATPNPDISGLGVIISFAFAAVLTTGAAVHAAVLDGMANKEHVVMPKFIADWLSKNRRPESIRNLEFQRELLDRLMIALADQQLLTGFALLVSAFVLAGKDVNNLESFDSKISWAQWDLVVLLSCLSSSSHLACVITLKHYFVKYHTSAWLRIILIILFAVLVAVSIDLGLRPFRPFWDLYDKVFNFSTQRVRKFTTYKVFYYLFYYAIPPFFVIYPFWISVMQLSQEIQSRVHNFLCLQWLPEKLKKHFRWKRFSNWLEKHKKCAGRWCIVRTTKNIARFLVFSNMTGAFCMQITFAAVSLFFVLMQKFYPTTHRKDGFITFCSLNNPEENAWGFGQMLALFMLCQPFVSAMGAYFELKERDKQAENTASWKSERSMSISYERVPGCEPSSDLSLPACLRRDTDFPTAHLPLLRSSGDLRSVLPRHETV